MLKQFITLHLFLYAFFALLSVGVAQTLPPETLRAAHRIQVAAVSDDKPLEAAEAFTKDFSTKFDFRAYVIHKDRWYKILLGDFVDKPALNAGLKRVRNTVKDAWPVAPDTDKIVAIWEKGRRVDFSQSQASPSTKSIRELPRIVASPERVVAEQLPVKIDGFEAEIETREQESVPDVRVSEILATPTPLPGVLEKDLLTPSNVSAPPLDFDELPDTLPIEIDPPVEEPDLEIPTPAPSVSLTLPEFSLELEELVAQPDESIAPEASSVDAGAETDELLFEIDDLRLADVLGVPEPNATARHAAARRASPVLLKISPDKPRLAAVGFEDGALELWDLETRELRFRNASHTGRIGDLSFRFKKQHLASVSVDGSFKLWAVKDGTEQQSLRLEIPDIQDVRFDHAKTRLLVLHQNRLSAFNPSDRTQEQIFPDSDDVLPDGGQMGGLDRLVCSPKADAALAFDLDCCAPVLFQQLVRGKEVALPELFGTPLSAAAFSATGNLFAIGRGRVVDFLPGKARVEVYQFRPSGKGQAPSIEFLLPAEAGLYHDVRSLAFSPKSSLLLAGHENGALQLFQLFSKIPSARNAQPELAARAGKLLRNFEGHSAAINSLAFFPDGKRVASVSEDGTLRVWDVESGKELGRLDFE